MSVFTEQTRSILPITWDALVNDSRIGEDVLNTRIKFVSTLVLGSLPADADQGALDVIVIEYIAKKSAISIIDIGIDFWMTQEETLTQSGSVEVVSYPDRVAALRDLKKNLQASLLELDLLVPGLIETPRLNTNAPKLSTIDDDLLTSNPQDFGPAYGPPTV